jgi:hypothetical protein
VDEVVELLGLRRQTPRQSFVAALELGRASEYDVHAAAGHVRGHRYLSDPPRLGDDLTLPLVVLGVQELMGDALPVQEPGELLVALH